MKLVKFRKNNVREDNLHNLGVFIDQHIVDLSFDEKIPKSIANILEGGKDLWNYIVNNAYEAPKKFCYHEKDIEFVPPITDYNKIICVGLNYKKHIEETIYEKPSYPVFFSRFPSSFVSHLQNIIKPIISDKCDYEGELAVVIGKKCKSINIDEANNFIAGYSICNDITIRDYQSKSSQWLIGKNFDNAGSLGPYIITKDELPLYANGLLIQTFVNDKEVQSDYTNNMIFSIAELIYTISEAITLNPGDMIVTGTPSGVGFARNPKIYLKDADICKVQIEKIGILENFVLEQ